MLLALVTYCKVDIYLKGNIYNKANLPTNEFPDLIDT